MKIKKQNKKGEIEPLVKTLLTVLFFGLALVIIAVIIMKVLKI